MEEFSNRVIIIPKISFRRNSIISPYIFLQFSERSQFFFKNREEETSFVFSTRPRDLVEFSTRRRNILPVVKEDTCHGFLAGVETGEKRGRTEAKNSGRMQIDRDK